MKLDLPTLMLQTLVFEVAMAALMLLYVRQRRVYPGFGHWTASTFAVAVAIAAFLARPHVPLPCSVFFVTGAVTLAGILRLDGVLRFTGLGGLTQWRYVLAPLVGVAFTAAATAGWNPTARAVVISFVVSVLTLLCARAILLDPKTRRSLHVTAAVLWTSQALGMMGRAVAWYLHPEVGEFDSVALHVLCFGLIIVSEVGLTATFVLLNSVRLENDLTRSRSKLASTLQDLAETLASLKILRGALSICSQCKKVRVASQTWEAIEVYVSRHADVEFSHGVCEDCLYLHYGVYQDGDSAGSVREAASSSVNGKSTATP